MNKDFEIPYPSWSIEVTLTFDSTMHTMYKDEGVTTQQLLKSLERCKATLKSFDDSLGKEKL